MVFRGDSQCTWKRHFQPIFTDYHQFSLYHHHNFSLFFSEGFISTKLYFNHFKMAMSGVTVGDECVQMWELLKQRKIKCCNFKLTKDMKKVEIEEGSVITRSPRDPPNSSHFEQWTSSLPENECRYSILRGVKYCVSENFFYWFFRVIFWSF